MSPGIGFALLSLLCAGVHDVVYRRYALKERSRGAYISAIGLVWALLQWSWLQASGAAPELSAVTLGFGLAAGLLLTLSNLALLESLTHMDAGLGSMIYRLNTVGVVILSVALLDESMSGAKLLGIALGLGAVLLLYRPQSEDAGRRFKLFFALAVLAALCRALYGVLSKAGLNQGASLQTMLLIAAFCWIAGGALYALLREGRFRITGKKALYALLSGLLVFLIVNFLLLAMTRGEASLVVPVANLSFVVALLFAALLGMERITWRKSAAALVAAGSLLVLARFQ